MAGWGWWLGDIGVVLTFAILLFLPLGRQLALRQRNLVAQRLWSGTPPRIRLVRRESLPWRRPAAVRKWVEGLLALGFEDAGQFEIAGMPGLFLRGFVKPSDAVFATVSEQRRLGVSLALSTYYADGTRLIYTTLVRGIFVFTAPTTTLVRAAEPSARALYERFLSERPAGATLRFTAADFAPRYEGAYAQMMDAVNARGGPDEVEIRRAYASAKRRLPSATASLIREVLARRAIAGLDVALRERFAAQQVGSGETVRDSVGERADVSDKQLVFVHDVMTLDDAIGLLGISLEPEREQSLERPVHAQPRQAFEALNASLPQVRQFRKVAGLTEPVAADVYEAPAAQAARPPAALVNI